MVVISMGCSAEVGGRDGVFGHHMICPLAGSHHHDDYDTNRAPFHVYGRHSIACPDLDRIVGRDLHCSSFGAESGSYYPMDRLLVAATTVCFLTL